MIERFKKSWLVVAVLSGVFAVLMIFCPAFVLDFAFEELVDMEMEGFDMFNVNGLKAVFGWEIKVDEEECEVLKFSFLQCLTYALPLIGVAVLCYSVKSNNKKAMYVAIGCFLASALLFFHSVETLQWESKAKKREVEDVVDFSLGAGAIIGGVCCLLSALCTCLHLNGEPSANVEALSSASQEKTEVEAIPSVSQEQNESFN